MIEEEGWEEKKEMEMRKEARRTDQAVGKELREQEIKKEEVAGGEAKDWRTKSRVNEIYRTFSPKLLSGIERNRPGEEGEQEEERGIER